MTLIGFESGTVLRNQDIYIYVEKYLRKNCANGARKLFLRHLKMYLINSNQVSLCVIKR